MVLALLARALGGSQQNSNSRYFNQHNSNTIYANQYSNAVQANFPYGKSTMQGSSMHSFKNSSMSFFSSSYSNESQVASSSGENLKSTIMKNSKTYEQL